LELPQSLGATNQHLNGYCVLCGAVISSKVYNVSSELVDLHN